MDCDTEQLTSLVREAIAVIDRLLEIDLPDNCRYFHSAEGHATCEVLRQLVLEFARGSENERSVVGWKLLSPNTRNSLTRLVLQLAVYNRLYLAAHCAPCRFTRRGSLHDSEASSSASGDAQATADHVHLQERLEFLAVRLQKPQFSCAETTVTLVYLLISVATVVLSWYAILAHAARNAWLAAGLIWTCMTLPDLLILRKESKKNTWWCSKCFLFKLVFPHSIPAALFTSWMSGVSAMRWSSRLSTDTERGSDRVDETSVDHERCRSFRKRLAADLRAAPSFLLAARFGFLPALIVQSCTIVLEADVDAKELDSDAVLMLVPPAVAYLLSTACAYTTFAGTGLTCQAVPYVYAVTPRMKLFLGTLVTIAARTVALALFLDNSSVLVIAGVLVLGLIFNAAAILWLDGRRLFDVGGARRLGCCKVLRRIWWVLLVAEFRVFEPYIVDPRSSLPRTVCAFILDLWQIAVFVGCSFRTVGHWTLLEHTSLVWLYLIGCTLQWWTFARFTPGEPRSPTERAMYEDVIVRKADPHEDLDDSSTKLRESDCAG